MAESRSMAKALVMSGKVYVDDTRIDKPGTMVRQDCNLLVKENRQKYVGRGGLKLEEALKHFNVDVDGYSALDIGASTGGFTDCLLKHGAKKVFAFDVGRGQLDWGLRNDERVVVKEKINCRYLKPEDVGEQVDLVVVDVSFISLELILKPAFSVLKTGGQLIALIKPQFEVGKGEVGKGGIVKDEKKHQEVIEKIKSFINGLGYSVKGVIPSPIEGADGNREFLIYAVS